MNKCIYISDLKEFENFLKGTDFTSASSPDECPIVYLVNEKRFVFRSNNVFYRKVPQLAGTRFLYALKHLESINNVFVPITDENGNVLFDQNEFAILRSKMGGIKEYTEEDFKLSDNLYFEGLDYYLERIDSNTAKTNEVRMPVYNEIIRVLTSYGFTVSIGNNSGGDIELVEAGSTMRGTNLPFETNENLDLDFTVRMSPDVAFRVKEALERGLHAESSITQTSRYKVRLLKVKIPGLQHPIDLDFSLTPQKEEYLSTEDALQEQLLNIRSQSEEKYRLVLANIMFAKAFLKECGAYKPSRGILHGDRSYGGIGGIGIENWILQNGGSFIDAARSFMAHAEGKEFIDFQKEYAVIDYGKNHVEVSKGNFPFDNFIMKNMRFNGFNLMKEGLKNFLLSLEQTEGNKLV